MDRAVLGWAALGSLAYVFLPWYAIEDGVFSLAWLGGYPGDRAVAPALVQALSYDRLWLLPVGMFVLASVLIVFMIAVVILIQALVGRRRLGRRAPAPVRLEGTPA